MVCCRLYCNPTLHLDVFWVFRCTDTVHLYSQWLKMFYNCFTNVLHPSHQASCEAYLHSSARPRHTARADQPPPDQTRRGGQRYAGTEAFGKDCQDDRGVLGLRPYRRKFDVLFLKAVFYCLFVILVACGCESLPKCISQTYVHHIVPFLSDIVSTLLSFFLNYRCVRKLRWVRFENWGLLPCAPSGQKRCAPSMNRYVVIVIGILICCVCVLWME